MRLAEGVILNLIPSYIVPPIILVRVTPAANRNTYSVAIMVVLAPRVAVFARNPGLGNRNTYSVAVACGKLCLSSPVSMWYGRVDYGPLVQLLPLGEGWDGASWLELLPLGR